MAPPRSAWSRPAATRTVRRVRCSRGCRGAMRRGGRWSWGALVPEQLRGRWTLGPGQVAVLAVGAAVGLALTCWWLLHSGGHDVSVPAALPTAPSALATPVGAVAPSPGGSPERLGRWLG